MRPGPIYAVLRLSALVAPLLACQNYQKFTPAPGIDTFGPSVGEVVLLEAMPSEPHVVIGYAETYATSLDQALPILTKLARANGGQAIVNLGETSIYMQAHSYRVSVIRYTDAAP